MKIYQEYADGLYRFGTSSGLRWHHIEQEVADGKAEIVPFDHAAAEREQERATQLAEAHQFLADTDWYVIRQMDSGVDIPIEIRQERQACRDLIDVINSTV